MFKKKLILLLFFSFFSYGYSQVKFTINYIEDHSQIVDTGKRPLIIYEPQINITRTYSNDPIEIDISPIKIFSMNTGDWIKASIKPNLHLTDGASLELKHLYLNGDPFQISGSSHDIHVESSWIGVNHKNLTGAYHISIAKNTPDFQSINIGTFHEQDHGFVEMGKITLITLHPLTVTVPDIDFGDVLVTSGTLTKSGQITVTGSANTKVSFDIPVHDFKLYKRGSSNGVSASADIDGRILKHEDPIRSNGNLTKNLNVTISNFSTLPPGRYEGDLLININSN